MSLRPVPAKEAERLCVKNTTGEHHSEQGQPGSEDQKSYILLPMRTLDLGQMQQCGWTWIT
jgi:hypothetical protein